MNYILDMREQVVVMLIWNYQKKEKGRTVTRS